MNSCYTKVCSDDSKEEGEGVDIFSRLYICILQSSPTLNSSSSVLYVSSRVYLFTRSSLMENLHFIRSI